MTAAALEDRLRVQAALEHAVTALNATSPLAMRPTHDPETLRLVKRLAAQREQITWLRDSLERDLCPPWLVEMVVARWAYIPEREWE